MIILNPDYHLKNPGYVLQYYSMSLILSFLSLQFAKPHRYFLLVKANSLAVAPVLFRNAPKYQKSLNLPSLTH